MKHLIVINLRSLFNLDEEKIEIYPDVGSIYNEDDPDRNNSNSRQEDDQEKNDLCGKNIDNQIELEINNDQVTETNSKFIPLDEKQSFSREDSSCVEQSSMIEKNVQNENSKSNDWDDDAWNDKIEDKISYPNLEKNSQNSSNNKHKFGNNKSSILIKEIVSFFFIEKHINL